MKAIETTRRDIQKIRNRTYNVNTKLTQLQSIVLSRRYPNLKPFEMVEQAIEEVINLQLLKEEKNKPN